MATRSYISYYDGERLVTQYCHYDGYIEGGVGETLQRYYLEPNRVKQLSRLGDLSVLTDVLEPTGEHSFDNREEGVTVAYGRDRGEEGTQSKVTYRKFKTVGEIFTHLRKYFNEEYNYVYIANTKEWYVSEYGDKPVKLAVALGYEEPNTSSQEPVKPKLFMTKTEATDVARKLRLNPNLLYGLVRNDAGEIIGVYTDEVYPKGFIVTIDWDGYVSNSNKRPTQKQFAEIIYALFNKMVLQLGLK